MQPTKSSILKFKIGFAKFENHIKSTLSIKVIRKFLFPVWMNGLKFEQAINNLRSIDILNGLIEFTQSNYLVWAFFPFLKSPTWTSDKQGKNDLP